MATKVGTTGVGLEVSFRISEAVNLRGGYYTLDYGTDIEEVGIEYAGDLHLRNAALFADWHVLGGHFRVSAGAIQTGNEFVGVAEGDLDVGDDTYDSVLRAAVDWRGLAPYAGVGFGNALRARRWSLALDVGVMFTGAPKVRLDGTTSDPAVAAAFREDLAREQADLQDELSDARYYPVLSLGFARRF